MGKNAPCLRCPDRHLGCHDACEKYQKFRAERDMVNSKRIAENDARFGRHHEVMVYLDKKKRWGQ